MCIRPAAPIRTDSHARSQLDALPSELKLVVLQQSGPNPYTVACMQQVSRAWVDVAEDHTLWAPLAPPEGLSIALADDDGAAAAATPSDKAQFAAYLLKRPRYVRRALHKLWHKPEPLVGLTHAACDPLFVHHAKIALPEPAHTPWRWSPLHPRNQGGLSTTHRKTHSGL